MTSGEAGDGAPVFTNTLTKRENGVSKDRLSIKQISQVSMFLTANRDSLQGLLATEVASKVLKRLHLDVSLPALKTICEEVDIKLSEPSRITPMEILFERSNVLAAELRELLKALNHPESGAFKSTFKEESK